MKKTTKYLLFFILVTLFIATTVYADDFSLWDIIDQQSQEIADLQRRLNEAERTPPPAPTPRPIQAPNVRLVSPQSIVLIPGEVQYVDMVVRNIGNAIASNTLVTASTEGPFSVEFLNNSNSLGNVSQNTDRTVRMRLASNVNAAAGSHSINLQFAYRTRDTNETSNDTISVRIDARARAPQIMLRDFAVTNAQITPGSSFIVSANLLNLGEGNAYSVQAAIADGLDPEGIFLSGSPNAPFLQTVAPGHNSTISFSFTASGRIGSGGTFPLVFELTGRDHSGEEISERFTYFVTVVAPREGENRGFLTLSATAPSGIFEVNDVASVPVVITNTGGLAARNIRVSANSDTEAIVPRSADRYTIGLLEPGESRTINFSFSPTARANSQYHTVGFEVSYDTDHDSDSFEQFVGFNVYNPDMDERRGGSRPRVLVSAYSVEPMIVSAGQEFDLSLTFRNTSANRAVGNIRITLTAVEYEERSGAVFTTVGASNTIFIDSLAPQEEATRVLRMFTVPNAAPRTYNIQVTMDYEDEDFEEFTETEQLSINVRQTTRIEVDNLNIPRHASPWSPVFVDFNIINSGRVRLSGLRISMEGDTFDVTGMNIWVGNMGAGNTASYSGEFTPMEPGEHFGVLIVSGEDEIGEIVEFREEFSIFVEEMMDWGDDMMHGREEWAQWDDFDEFGQEQGGGVSRILLIVIGVIAVVAVAAVVAILILRKRRNNRDIFQELQ